MVRAYEVLTAHYEKAAKAADTYDTGRKGEGRGSKTERGEERGQPGEKGRHHRTIFGTMIGAAATSFLRSMATQAGRQVFDKGGPKKFHIQKRAVTPVLGRAPKPPPRPPRER